ncbi:MAG TPA: hypothetical protein VKX46_09945, partial [Ktedonobacteraceae bacterium]|nr:hypothetical protein [Ktedonobacteraceae bacterium]
LTLAAATHQNEQDQANTSQEQWMRRNLIPLRNLALPIQKETYAHSKDSNDYDNPQHHKHDLLCLSSSR